ncbi:hypothetical protein BDZ85DRAFT_258314 [Elsinoe ampelina]|uniref:Uncharacterized protein n=1 Tax=Elsinoe ampelina TaxID=302913 RepID=A0A6A6GJW4_9PEZI|nr:hypothetical protein BDZ85DRAFT_258314 [Elsinoe ampelina]
MMCPSDESPNLHRRHRPLTRHPRSMVARWSQALISSGLPARARVEPERGRLSMVSRGRSLGLASMSTSSGEEERLMG